MDEATKQHIKKYGYAFLQSLNPNSSTMEVARTFGTPLEVSKQLGHRYIPDIQSLKPRQQNDNLKNQYSGYFGLGEFPLHTDLAHWSCPPRYLLLRCIVGSVSVKTNYIHIDKLEEMIGNSLIKKSVVKLRRSRVSTANCLLPTSFCSGGVDGVRWDSLFLSPMNIPANKITNYLCREHFQSTLEHVILRNSGDTIIIDNWKMLHGRSAVDIQELGRLIERAYLTDLEVNYE
ncbi:MAG: hypothetical protein RPU43_08580 [Candidatus Sedimenticola sp. (ex Thyasira tokunagai)]